MRRREFIALGAIVAVWPVQTVAHPKAKLPLVGILWHAGSPEEEGVLYQSLHQGFRDIGLVPGQNLLVEERFPGEVAGRFDQFAKELVDLNPDVLVAISPPSVQAVRKATSALPVVFLAIADPLALKLVASLSRPGGNMTGLSSMEFDIAAKRVELVKETIPAVASIALLLDGLVPYFHVNQIAESKGAGERLKVKVSEFKVYDVDELEPTFAAIARHQCEAIVLAAGPMFFLQHTRISKLAKKYHIPMIGPAEVFAGSGFLMSYGASWPAIFRRAPVYVEKILKGAKPADLPIEQPTKLDLVVNLQAAKVLGIEVPPLVLARADRVIE
jgi:putative ABC transport system substrate-binding protein